jgi:hypothetical protein
MFQSFKWGMAYLAPRGVGPTAWTGSDKAQTQRLRRFYLLGETHESTQVYDIHRSIQGLRQIQGLSTTKLWLTAERQMAANALYASLFEPNITRLDLHHLPSSHDEGPAYLNVLRFMDIPTAAVLAAERSKVILYTADETTWKPTVDTVSKLGFSSNLQLRKPAVPKGK